MRRIAGCVVLSLVRMSARWMMSMVVIFSLQSEPGLVLGEFVSEWTKDAVKTHPTHLFSFQASRIALRSQRSQRYLGGWWIGDESVSWTLLL